MSNCLTPSERLRAAFELHDAGLEMVRARFRRDHPEQSEADIHEMLVAWLSDRAEHYDLPGFRLITAEEFQERIRQRGHQVE